MSELLAAEIAGVLTSHFLVEPNGWTRAPGVIEYECNCGELFIVDTRKPGFAGRDTHISDHQAARIQALGVCRTPDHFDETALDAVANLVIERKRAAIAALSEPASCATNTELTRLEGALTELNEFAVLIGWAVRTRANNGFAQLFPLRN